MPNLTVQAVRWPSPDIFELVLDRRGIEFEPGDCFAIYHPRRVSRPYSTTSGTGEPCLRFLIRQVQGGRLSGWLAERQPGDEVTVSEPFGLFRPGKEHGDGGPCVFIATGTGIAPMLSALRSRPELHPAACLWGVRRLADAVELEYLAERCPLTVCVSREAVPATEGSSMHHHGRVTDLLDRIPHLPATQYYLCGLDVMIDESSNWLERHGISPNQIHREVFFYA